MSGPPRVQLTTLYTRILSELAGSPRMSQEALARRLDVTLRTIQRHLAELEDEGYIAVDRAEKPFVYVINWSKRWEDVEGFHLILIHPEVSDAIRAISELASRTVELAATEGRSPGEALTALFADPSTEAART